MGGKGPKPRISRAHGAWDVPAVHQPRSSRRLRLELLTESLLVGMFD